MLHMMRMLKEFGVSIYFEDKDIDSDKLNSEMFVTFPGMAAQQESEAISGNVRWSIQKRMKTGDYNCTFAAYGFDRKNGELIVKENEAEVVRKIFYMYLQGAGLQTIANRLNEEGIPRRYGYTVWHQTAVRYILTNERYKGDAVLQKQYRTEVLPRRQKRNKREKKQYYVENANPPIVSRETFDTAQVLLNSRKDTLQTLKAHIGIGLGTAEKEDNTMEIEFRIAQIDAEFKTMIETASADTVDGFDENRMQQLIAEKNELQEKLGEITEERGRQQTVQDRLETIYTVLDGLKNHPMTYDDEVVRQLIDCVVVESKDRIKVVFCGGLQVEQPLRQECIDFVSEIGQIAVNI